MEKKLETKEIFQGRIIKVTLDKVELENGVKTTREIVHHGGSVAMLVYDKPKDEMYFVKQYRYAVGENLLEIPAGTLENGEDPEKAVERELAEEIKKKAGKISFLGKYYQSPGFITECMHLYLCTDLEEAYEESDYDEEIEVVKMKSGEFKKMIEEKKVSDGKSVLAFLLWQESKDTF